MRWFLAFYVILSLGLSILGFIYLYGFQFDGMPLGYTYKGQDISGMQFQQLVDLLDKNSSYYKPLVFTIRGIDRDIRLELDKGWFLRVDRQALTQNYRKILAQNPIYVRLINYLTLDYQNIEFSFDLSLDQVRTEKSLKRYITSQEIIDKIIATMKEFIKNKTNREVILSIKIA